MYRLALGCTLESAGELEKPVKSGPRPRDRKIAGTSGVLMPLGVADVQAPLGATALGPTQNVIPLVISHVRPSPGY